MKIIFLKDFCVTGSFGDVQIGMPIAEVKKVLGKPDHEQNFGTGSSGMVYGWYEFFYWTDTQILNGIQNDHLASYPHLKGKASIKAHIKDITYKNTQFEIDIWFLKPGQDITYQEVIEHLLSENIQFIEKQNEFEDRTIEFKSGVYFDFEEPIDENGNVVKNKEKQLLNGMRLFKFE